jgi:TRAP-type C4-dicarboxylate transport system substrate-binding protein
VGIGAHYVGGFTINKKSFNRFPPEVQKLFMEVGQDYTKQAAKVQAEAAETFRVQMQKAGAKFSTLPAEEKTKWVKAMPNLAREWTERLEPQGLPAKAVLKAYMDELRARGAKPLRDWEK